MNIIVKNAEEIMNIAKKPFERKTALISIRGVGDPEIDLNNKPYASLFVVFDDTFPAEAKLLGDQPLLFSEEIAKKIVVFVKENFNKVDEIICQCRCGKSRSSAVAAAIEEYFFQNGKNILESKIYRPNMFVYTLLVESFLSY